MLSHQALPALLREKIMKIENVILKSAENAMINSCWW